MTTKPKPDDVEEDKDRKLPSSGIQEMGLGLIFNLLATVEELKAALLRVTGRSADDEVVDSQNFAKSQLEIMERENLVSNSVIEVFAENESVVKVNRELVKLNFKERIVFEILLGHLLRSDFNFISSTAIIKEIRKSFSKTTWKDPQPGDLATAFCSLKKKLPPNILETPKKRGPGYGHRISIPPQNVVLNRDEEVR